MKLAIIIPYYKLEFFDETLNSLANQSDHRFNLYIGDDASPESPENLLSSYASELNFTYRRFDENLGQKSLTKQWDRCIDLAGDEEWMMILGDDDVLGTKVVEAFYTIGENQLNSTNVIHYQRETINEHSEVIRENRLQKKMELSHYIYYRKIIGQLESSLSEFIFRKKKYEHFGFHDYPLGWCSDDRAIIEFSTNKPIYFVQSAKVRLRISQKSISGSKDHQQVKAKTVLDFQFWYYERNRKKLSKNEIIRFLNKMEYAVVHNENLKNKYMNWFLKQYLKNYSSLPFLKFLRRYMMVKMRSYRLSLLNSDLRRTP